VEKRNGFDGTPMTLEAIGNMMGVTRERVRQIENKAYRKIKTRGKKEFLEYLGSSGRTDNETKPHRKAIQQLDIQKNKDEKTAIYDHEDSVILEEYDFEENSFSRGKQVVEEPIEMSIPILRKTKSEYRGNTVERKTNNQLQKPVDPVLLKSENRPQANMKNIFMTDRENMQYLNKKPNDKQVDKEKPNKLSDIYSSDKLLMHFLNGGSTSSNNLTGDLKTESQSVNRIEQQTEFKVQQGIIHKDLSYNKTVNEKRHEDIYSSTEDTKEHQEKRTPSINQDKGLVQYIRKSIKCSKCNSPMYLAKGRTGKYYLKCSSCYNTALLNYGFVNEYIKNNNVLCPEHKCLLRAGVSKYGIYVRCKAGHFLPLDTI
ncbi:MAG: hypothetical protein J5589_04420, partial [Firmicutes bacterium]|nr:hypothetical protein [Bacillota bacterium]